MVQWGDDGRLHMRHQWVFLLICIGIFSGGVLGCAHQPDIEQPQTISEPDQEAKNPPPGLNPEKDRGEAAASRRARMPGLLREINVFENEDITFDYDAYAISPAAAEILKTKAAFLAANPSLMVQIEGHCDERGTVEYNLALGDRRAKAARDYLCALGIASERIRTVSYGEERPLDPGQTEEGWAKNRRCHFLIPDE